MATSTRPLIAWTDDQTLRLVRPQVSTLLESSPAFHSLSVEERRQIIHTMVKVCSYMVNPEGLKAQELSSRKVGVLIRAAQGTVESIKRWLLQSPRTDSKDLHVGGVRESVDQFGALVQKIDFPNFVSGLIQGVFKAIIDFSVQQMKACVELLTNAANVVDQFTQDRISENSARDWLSEKYSGELDIDRGSVDSSFAEDTLVPTATCKLVATGGNSEELLERVSANLQLAKPVTDISDPEEEKRLVTGARLQMAHRRQQLLCSMVLLGINRIVVTDTL